MMFEDILYATKDGLLIVGAIAKKKIAAFKLNRKFSVENMRDVQMPPQVRTSCYVDLYELSRRKFGDAIANFSRILERKFIGKDLTYFYKNIKTLKIKDLVGRVKTNILGSYYVGHNEIILYNDYLKSIYHELFHMASSCYRDDVYYSGFSQNGEHDIGRGLNEGYTELLTRRYFGGFVDFVPAYEEEVRIAKYIEKIVGQFKMESCYLRANLIGLIRELRFYLTETEVTDLITDIDKMHYLNNSDNSQDYSSLLHLEYLKNIYFTIFRAYARKLCFEIEDRIVMESAIDTEIKKFVEEDYIFSDIDGVVKEVISIEDFYDIFDEELDKNNMRNSRYY